MGRKLTTAYISYTQRICCGRSVCLASNKSTDPFDIQFDIPLISSAALTELNHVIYFTQ